MSRETILVALATRVGAQRAPWPAIPDSGPFTLLADGQEAVTARDYDDDIVSMTVGIRRAVRAASDSSRSTEANAVLEGLIAETFGSDQTLGGLCEAIRYLEGSTEYPTDSTDLIGATAIFTVDYIR